MVGKSGSGKSGSAEGGGGKNFKSFTTAEGKREAARVAPAPAVLHDRAVNFFAPRVGKSTGGSAVEGNLRRAEEGDLRRPEQALADSILLRVVPTGSHGGIKVMDKGRWPASDERRVSTRAGLAAARRLDREEEEDGAEELDPDDGLAKEWYWHVTATGRNVPLRISAWWVKSFGSGKVAQAAGKNSIDLVFKIRQHSSFGTPVWACWDFAKSADSKVFTGDTPHELLAAWMSQPGSGVSMGRGGGPKFVGISCVELQTFLRKVTPGFDEIRLQQKPRKRSSSYWARDTSKSLASQKRRTAEACGAFHEAMCSKDADRPQDVFWWAQQSQQFRMTGYGDVSAAHDFKSDKMVRAMVSVYEDAIRAKDFRTADIQLGTFASGHTVAETCATFGVGKFKVKRAKKRVRLGMRLMMLTGKRHVSRMSRAAVDHLHEFCLRSDFIALVPW